MKKSKSLRKQSLRRLTASAIAFLPLGASAHPDLAARPKTIVARSQTPAPHTEHVPRAHLKSIPAHRIK